MTMTNPNLSANRLDERLQLRNSVQLDAAIDAPMSADSADDAGDCGEESVDEVAELERADEPNEESAEEESIPRGTPQTREAYLKKGEDLIRSLL